MAAPQPLPLAAPAPSDPAHLFSRRGGLLTSASTSTSTMPGIPAAVAPAVAISSPAPFLAFGDDDDGFGDFKFASFAQPLPASAPQQQDDDDWGEFVIGSGAFESPAPPQPLFDAFLSDSASSADAIAGAKQWEKPRGALPLAIFGEEEAEEHESDQPPVLFSPSFSSSSPAKDRKRSVAAGGELRDLITSLYGPPPQPAAEEQTGPRLPEGEEDDFEESAWEFKDASSSSPNSVLKEDGMGKDKTGVESMTAVDFSKVEVIRIGSGDHPVANGWIGVGSDRQAVSNGFRDGVAFVSFASSLNDLDVHVKKGNTQSGDDWFSGLENGEKRSEQELWEFSGNLLENKIVTSSGQESREDQKIQDNESNVLGPTNGTQVTGSAWESNLVDWPIHSYSNVKEESDARPFYDQNGYSFKPTFVGNAINGISSSPSDGLKNTILDMFIEVDQDHSVCPAKDTTKKEQNSDMVKSAYNNHDPSEIQWEFPKTPEIVARNQDSAFTIDKDHSTNLTYDTVVVLYRRLKDGSISLLNCHLNDLKKAYEVASLSGDKVKVLELDEEIKAAYKKLEEAKGTEITNMGEQPAKDTCINQLLIAVEEPTFRAFEIEYHLSERILSAGKELSAAIKLLEHTTSVHHILELASTEEQHAYIHTWSDMAVTCLRELQHSAMIWQESVKTQTFMQILSQEIKYFIALGEIYRVTEVLRASSKLCKPWILLNWGGSSKLLTSLDKCAEAWTISGLEKALETISEANDVEHAGLAKALLASIKAIHDLDPSHYSSYQDKKICTISLLPMEELQGMKMELWCGKHYFVKLANLWANRISHDPPQLPHLHVR